MKELYITPQGESEPQFILNHVKFERQDSSFLELHNSTEARQVIANSVYTIYPMKIDIVIHRDHTADNAIEFQLKTPS